MTSPSRKRPDKHEELLKKYEAYVQSNMPKANPYAPVLPDWLHRINEAHPKPEYRPPTAQDLIDAII